jgi:nitrite reductase/ring-hydroxylating ferredoxin subunit
MKQIVCKTNELAPGEIRKAQLGPIPVVVIRAGDGTLHGLVAKCLHQGGPLDQGKLYDDLAPGEPGEYTPKEGCEVLKCPWHGYEYDIRTGCVVADPSRRLQLFTVVEEGDDIVVQMAPPAPAPAAVPAAAAAG